MDHEYRVRNSFKSVDPVTGKDFDHDPMNCLSATLGAVVIWFAILSPLIF